jgi:hypothetical protein
VRLEGLLAAIREESQDDVLLEGEDDRARAVQDNVRRVPNRDVLVVADIEKGIQYCRKMGKKKGLVLRDKEALESVHRRHHIGYVRITTGCTFPKDIKGDLDVRSSHPVNGRCDQIFQTNVRGTDTPKCLFAGAAAQLA